MVRNGVFKLQSRYTLPTDTQKLHFLEISHSSLMLCHRCARVARNTQSRKKTCRKSQEWHCQLPLGNNSIRSQSFLRTSLCIGYFTAFLNLSGNSSCLEEAAAAVAERFPGPMKCRHSWRVWVLLMTQSEHWTHWMNKLFHDINCA